MNAIRSVDRFNKIDERAREDFRAAYGVCGLYSFLSQIMPSFDGEFERFYPPVVATAGRDIPQEISSKRGTIFCERGTIFRKGVERSKPP